MSNENVQSDKPAALKAMVIARYIAGESKALIGRELQIARQTVIKIVKEAKIDDYIETGKQDALQLVPRAMMVLEEALGSYDESVRLRAAGMILKGMGILNDKLIVEEHKQADVGNLPSYFSSDAGVADQPN